MENKKIIMPNYEKSILNLVNSILKHYNVETKYKELPELKEILKKDYKNIVLVILDGMGEHILRDVSDKGFFMNNHIDKITSVCPSTTTAAMTTYYSGKPPIETGWISMSQYFKEQGRAVEMLRERYSYTGESIDYSRFNIFDLIKYTTIYEKIELASPDVKAYEINPEHCRARSKRNINANNIELLCDAIKAICKNDDKNFILAYNDNPDVLLHKYGCKSSEVSNFIKNAEVNIKNMCEDLKDSNTLIIISADHGHRDIKKIYDVLDLKDIQECMMMPASFESRAVTFWIKEDKKKQFEEIFYNQFNGEFMLFTKEEFLQKKLLGDGIKHPKVDDFLGNYIAIAISDSIIKLNSYIGREKANKKATHCGFTEDEMEVPLIVIDCDE